MFWVSCCDVLYDFRINVVLAHLYLLLFVGGLMYYLGYVCLLAHSGVQCILCCVFALFSSSCLHYVSSFSDSPFLIASSVFSNVYLNNIKKCTYTVDHKYTIVPRFINNKDMIVRAKHDWLFVKWQLKPFFTITGSYRIHLE